jgi:predicted Zn-dependent peptidase
MIGDAEADVRGRLGATYGARAFRDQHRGPTRYEVHAAVDAARAGEAIAAMRSAIDDLRHDTDFAEHFARARRSVAHHLMDESSMSNAIATQLASLAELDQPPTYFDQLLRQVGVVMPDDVSKLLASELPAAHEVVVLAADRETLVKAFEAAGIHDYKLIGPSEH